jgi:carbonic anhydrase/acetyltransferase-like protein (isoleucine patch superfamily)
MRLTNIAPQDRRRPPGSPPDANIIGRVVIEARASASGSTSTLRGDNEPIVIWCEGTNVQENCVLHTDMGYPLTIGERELHDRPQGDAARCTIGDGSLIGMGAIVLNGARIGRGCLIGAGALVTEGKEIPDGALVMGAPGKVVRTLDNEAQARLLKSRRKGISETCARFRAGLTPV